VNSGTPNCVLPWCSNNPKIAFPAPATPALEWKRGMGIEGWTKPGSIVEAVERWPPAQTPTARCSRSANSNGVDQQLRTDCPTPAVEQRNFNLYGLRVNNYNAFDRFGRIIFR
jgi:hypothetical protein